MYEEEQVAALLCLGMKLEVILQETYCSCLNLWETLKHTAEKILLD